MATPKIERLMQLTAELLAASTPLSADQIRRRVDGYPDGLDAFRRMFERDKVDLREMGVPITVAAVVDANPPVDGYRIRKEDYFLRDPGLLPDELAAITLASHMVRFDTGTVDEALWKLGASQAETATASTPSIASLQLDPAVTVLFEAISQHRMTEFGYNDEPRQVEPLQLRLRNGRWYLDGWDRGRSALRRFRVDRFEGRLQVSDETFEPAAHPQAGEDRAPWEFDDAPARSALVLIDAEQADWAKAQIGEDKVVEQRDDGAIVVSVEVTNVANFRSLVLGFGQHAEILEPADLRDDLISWLQAMIEADA